ncbi:hypothetical protein [Psychrobacillus sp. FSL K6-1267]|uniref:hypothetical protein n=1 Tax=Psychrobacillus sp. FSL K6-1267 TaxID=2921543 RepID=UPI0030F8EA62
MSEIKCIVCGGSHFLKGYYEIDVDVDIYPTAYNNVEVTSRSNDDVHIYIDVGVTTTIENEIVEKGDISFNLISEENNGYRRYNESVKTYKYICEDCGFIMSFIKEKLVESKIEEKKRKQKENTYDWSGFGK